MKQNIYIISFFIGAMLLMIGLGNHYNQIMLMMPYHQVVSSINAYFVLITIIYMMFMAFIIKSIVGIKEKISFKQALIISAIASSIALFARLNNINVFITVILIQVGLIIVNKYLFKNTNMVIFIVALIYLVDSIIAIIFDSSLR